MVSKLVGRFVRDRSPGNCAYYEVLAPSSSFYLKVIRIATVSNTNEFKSIQVYHPGEVMIIGAPGLTEVSRSEMMGDILSTASSCKDLIGGMV